MTDPYEKDRKKRGCRGASCLCNCGLPHTSGNCTKHPSVVVWDSYCEECAKHNEKKSLAKSLLKTTPQWFINYLWNSGFAYGNVHGYSEGLNADKSKSYPVIATCIDCIACGKSHIAPNINLEEAFKREPTGRMSDDLIESSDYGDEDY